MDAGCHVVMESVMIVSASSARMRASSSLNVTDLRIASITSFMCAFNCSCFTGAPSSTKRRSSFSTGSLSGFFDSSRIVNGDAA